MTATAPSLLAGMVSYENLGWMTPTHSTKNGVRCRYYVSRGLTNGRRRDPTQNSRGEWDLVGRRIAAGDLIVLNDDDQSITRRVQVKLKRRGREVRVVIDGPGAGAGPGDATSGGQGTWVPRDADGRDGGVPP